MKIIIKTLKGQMIEIDVEATTSILSIKEKIKAIKGFEIESQKIVLKGKQIQNQDTVEKLNIKEKQFLIVMATIKKPENKKQQASKTPQNKQSKPQINHQLKIQQKPESKTSQKNSNNQSEPAQQTKVSQLVSMGFSRQKSILALRAAFGNTERAVDYALNGIPPGLIEGQNQGQGRASNAEAFVNIGREQLQQLRELARNNPSTIPQILAQLAQISPSIYNLISQHPEQFERMVMSDEVEEGQQDEDYVSDSIEHEENQVTLSQAEEQAIERLSSLGFSKIEAAQAYIACDKNEQMAANLLFDRLGKGDMEEDFEQDLQGDDDNLFN